MKNVLLDTNAYVGFLNGDENVFHSISKAVTVYMSVFVLGELYAGFRGGNRERKNKEILERFLNKSSVRILSATEETAEIFGKIKHELKSAGTPIPINDVWIASHAIETGSVVITYDAHFLKIAGIRLWDFLTPLR